MQTACDALYNIDARRRRQRRSYAPAVIFPRASFYLSLSSFIPCLPLRCCATGSGKACAEGATAPAGAYHGGDGCRGSGGRASSMLRHHPHDLSSLLVVRRESKARILAQCRPRRRAKGEAS
ncbi:hypothetical protein PVAP13_1KG003450 [Panicum virgatum]|uniref:Uncharacterized protein n=1 Tax=Panicum virgatum TaxID=38727 RepID=A0A8T0XBS9_PANVG|nr:hypothetical protein PVAP13_1KG003450 [Panicum virgatum]